MSNRSYTQTELVGLGEGQMLEFKRSGSLFKEAFTSLCAMVNAMQGSGKIVFGIEPNNQVCGLGDTNLDGLQQTLALHASQKFDPVLHIEQEPALCEGLPVLIVTASRHRSIPFYEYDGRAYIRMGSVNQMLGVADKNHLSMQRDRDRHNGPWICDRCGTWMGQFTGMSIGPDGPKKSYSHGCGGEVWPAV